MWKSLISQNKQKAGLYISLTTEADDIAIGQCCAQILLMVHQLCNYDLSFKPVKLTCDNSSVICLSKKILHHSRSKHIDVKHHLIRDHDLNDDTEI